MYILLYCDSMSYLVVAPEQTLIARNKYGKKRKEKYFEFNKREMETVPLTFTIHVRFIVEPLFINRSAPPIISVTGSEKEEKKYSNEESNKRYVKEMQFQDF